MCHREVSCARFSCGHTSPQGEGNKVDCQSFRCRYSDLHPTACGNCPATCTQW
ncbi:hypothetical protein PLEOSDRAFT_12493, partial [Pleurotus ostreatus PC15]